MSIYDSDNCAVFKCHFGHSIIFSSSGVFDIHAYITSILFECKSFSVDTISREARLTLITNDFHHHFTTSGNEIKDGPVELCCKLDAQSLATNMEICPASALAISASIFRFETSNDCIISSNIQTDPFTAPVLVTTTSQFPYDFKGTLLRMYCDYHIHILRLSCELSCTSVYMAFLALCEITTSALLHAVYFGRSSDCHHEIDSCEFDGANYDQSSVFIRRSCIDFTVDTNEIDYTTSIGGCDTATTTTTTAPTTATTTTATKRYNHITECWGGG